MGFAGFLNSPDRGRPNLSGPGLSAAQFGRSVPTMEDHRPDPAEEIRPANPAQVESEDAPLGGDDTTEEQLDADNEVEKDSLKTLDPDDAPA
ncbi:MAG TPA: hypothetical protein DIW46_01170 [Microbacterium sp.]|nr:hypothetical protein [Microbacterium sp.]